MNLFWLFSVVEVESGEEKEIGLGGSCFWFVV